MKRIGWIALVLCAAFVTTTVVVAAAKPKFEDPTARAAKEAAANRKKLPPAYADLKSLADDQVQKLIDIHKKAQDDIKAIQEKEQTDSRALLTDAQKTELDEAIAKKGAERKAKQATKKGADAGAAATQPAEMKR
ncbi:MAG TPA: hypothetical protein VIL86_02585 [Tepidisphaeraceae bacterium]|jgi:hypothetical protein